MKAVIQRVKNASVSVEGRVKGQISEGLLVYLGVARDDTDADALWIADKAAGIRIFEDDHNIMNLSLQERLAKEMVEGAGVLAVSQFTLLGDARKGRRPSWNNAASGEAARPLYERFIARIRELGLLCETGVFQTHMDVTYTNDGPVTILLDSREA
ncbi:MAG: D-tyrosyl-tRNA(Tyr) deacylase [Treponema sp.]|jgi:D-tyrosyl-tRNA(Tyr) deacylase|nr:D-tyrosyl-tRNA(Tyr) deacylase [Treponema sp.]